MQAKMLNKPSIELAKEVDDKPWQLLNYIGDMESRAHGGYNNSYGNKAIALDKMTLGEVLEEQQELRKNGEASSAMGRYQIIYKTLKDLTDRNPKDMPLSRVMDKETQDELAMILLKRRGLEKFQNGEMSEEDFGHQLSMEWASVPLITDHVTKSGKHKGRVRPAGTSYYAKDGLNKALSDTRSALAAMRSLNSGQRDKA
jgi:muramidase (phage lysozyme)